ncbi:MAG: hypothetical protein Q4B30_00565 [Coriobacteriaceae bacterium]|nr:hypothetical protein [Coriobacteriaceae bacterium]
MDGQRVSLSRGDFNHVCNYLARAVEKDSGSSGDSDSRLLHHLMEHAFWMHGDADEQDEPFVRVVLTPSERSVVNHILRFDAPCGDDVDYFVQTLANIEARRAEWSATWERDKNAVRCYLSEHEGEKIIKAQVARELGIAYSRCLEIFRKIANDG